MQTRHKLLRHCRLRVVSTVKGVVRGVVRAR